MPWIGFVVGSMATLMVAAGDVEWRKQRLLRIRRLRRKAGAFIFLDRIGQL
jgi:hypothetical protein